MRLRIAAMLLLGGVFLMSAHSAGDENEPHVIAVSAVLDQLHDAASKADGERYFALFADDAVFLGTDATERWPIAEFRAYAMKRFASGTGWTYALKHGSRHITVVGDIAWFDELLENAKYGTCRGSGVLRKVGDQWRIAQYNLTFTVPNDAAAEVVKLIQSIEPGAAEAAPN
jgi:ketosteroid isomerase-like protein